MQLKLNLNKGRKGGRRSGSGRKRLHSKGVAHRPREIMTWKTPLHINFKVKTFIQNKKCLKILRRAIVNARKFDLKVIHFSLQSNHIHLIVEAENNQILTQGMRSLTITFAKNIKKGRIQLDRYHLHVLRTLRETKNAVYYVLFNEQKHKNLKRAYVSSYSSLGTVSNLKNLAQSANMTIILKKINELTQLESAQSLLMKKTLSG